MRGHDCVFHRTGTHEQLGETWLAVLAIKNNRSTRLAKVGIDEEGVEPLLGKSNSVIRTTECLAFTGHRAGEKKGAGIFVDAVHRERRSKRSKRLRHDAGALFVGHQNAGPGRKTELGNGSNHIHAGELLHLIHCLDAGIQHEKRNSEADTGSEAAEEALNPSLRRAGADGGRAHGRLVNANRRLGELFGDIHFLQA